MQTYRCLLCGNKGVLGKGVHTIASPKHIRALKRARRAASRAKKAERRAAKRERDGENASSTSAAVAVAATAAEEEKDQGDASGCLEYAGVGEPGVPTTNGFPLLNKEEDEAVKRRRLETGPVNVEIDIETTSGSDSS